VDCDDDNLCTVDSCSSTEGCVHDWIDSVACNEDEAMNIEGIIVHDMQEGREMNDVIQENESINTENNQPAAFSLSGWPIAGIVVGGIALVAVMGLIGYKISQQKSTPSVTVSDNAYTSM
jgi:hypothetical protein